MNKEPNDWLPDHPLLAVAGVWKEFDLDYLLDDELPYWFLMAVSTNLYEDTDDRQRLVEFFYDFLEFIESMFFFNKSRNIAKKRKVTVKPMSKDAELFQSNLPRRLKAKDVARPMPVIVLFCQRYTFRAAKKELADCFESVIAYEGRFKDAIFKENIFRLYNYLACLLEAGYLLCRSKLG